jgi:hypothetical protein
MNRNTSKTLIVITTLITAVIHLVLLNFLLGKIDIPFTLNGLGYLSLLALFLLQPAFLSGRPSLLYLAYLGFTAVTILAWFFLGDLGDPLGIITKIDEAVLLLALISHWRAKNA